MTSFIICVKHLFTSGHRSVEYKVHFQKDHVFPDTWATCCELPSYTSTMPACVVSTVFFTQSIKPLTKYDRENKTNKKDKRQKEQWHKLTFFIVKLRIVRSKRIFSSSGRIRQSDPDPVFSLVGSGSVWTQSGSATTMHLPIPIVSQWYLLLCRRNKVLGRN